ncbi:Deoxyhypusine synthase [Wickerhamiella sorbophila]|uniref:Deoxyhypusine synthase n=1 Tax=Wickerhamiella sorbophila TaxID=45607 RepID=A0A2T0FCW6_9ASCO|nr:Deoxyhypusine synthase [Wickerhamiella sorbophila]PRT52848.1 Deoxyhypusine synthase [Wickerhamiella sorbophila]
MSDTPQLAADAVLKKSEAFDGAVVDGIDFDADTAKNASARTLIDGMRTMGFQASGIARGAEIIDKMRTWEGKDDDGNRVRTTIFLGYTSNLISSGMRSTIRYLVKHKLVSAIVTTGGGIEEDLIKCMAPTYMGEFSLKGSSLRDKGLNRIGNLIVPNDNYCQFEEWVMPILQTMCEEQNTQGINWTPSKVIDRLGKEINNEESVLYWAHKNQIPVFCPALTDGSLGDMLFFHTFKEEQHMRVDLVEDIRRINTMAMNAARAGMIILGGGIVKHHIANACLMRNGADYAVYINTAQEFDGSDAGARPDEAISWGKIKADAEHVKIYCEVTAVFPLIVAATFASGDAGPKNAAENDEN